MNTFPFDHRFAWSAVPPSVSVAGDVLIALGFLIDFFVFKENSLRVSAAQLGNPRTHAELAVLSGLRLRRLPSPLGSRQVILLRYGISP